MSLAERMDLIKTTLAELCPARVVTRSLKNFAERQPAELKRGIYTLVSQGESGYSNLINRAAMDGRHRLLLVGQIQIGEKAAPEEVENAEFAMVEEIKTFCRNLPPALACMDMLSYTQSQQVDAPYGWIGVELEITS